ncbi:MAG: glucosaminidase domain-containing protein [Saprospiraceae bacterium]|nr:glucosaminidase domain-containing protein [Saprospiraceae bacterium]
MRLLHILSVGFIFLLPKSASANYIPDFKQQLFIETWANLAVDQMRQYGIPASITLAQAIVESGWGDGYVAKLANNYFCIKGNNGWTGPVVKAKDDDPDSSSFRQYLNIEESFTDHSKFLLENRRYQPLFDLNAYDYKGWAYGLKAAGYATKPDYAEYLIATIEKYGLYLYDYAVPANQIKSLSLQVEQQEQEDVMMSPTHDPVIHLPMLDIQKDSKASSSEEGQPMSAPGYHFDRESATVATTKPEVEMPADKKHVKIPLILPKAAPTFSRR